MPLPEIDTKLEPENGVFVNGQRIAILGSSKSGHYGHAGIPGHRGGSAARGAVSIQSTEQAWDITSKQVASNWDVLRKDLDALALEEKVSLVGMSDSAAKETLAYGFIRRWTGSSGGPVATRAITAVCDDLGLSYSLYKGEQQSQDWMKEHPSIDRAASSFGRAMYAQTQAQFKKNGVAEVGVMRSGSAGEGRPFTSWSTNWGGVRHEEGRQVIKATIPIERVFSTPTSGFGSYAESEVVVLPRADLGIEYTQMAEEDYTKLPTALSPKFLEEGKNDSPK